MDGIKWMETDVAPDVSTSYVKFRRQLNQLQEEEMLMEIL